MDEFKENCIYFMHNESNKVYKIPEKVCNISGFFKKLKEENNNIYKNNNEKSPIIIRDIDKDTIPFIHKYFIYQSGKKNETRAPEKPLNINIHISYVLGDEYELFTSIYNENDEIKTKISKINNLIETSEYFKFSQLTDKLCAIICSIIRATDLSELEKLFIV